MEPDSLGSGAETSGLEHFRDQIQALNARFPPVAQPGTGSRETQKTVALVTTFRIKPKSTGWGAAEGKSGINYHNRRGFTQPRRGNGRRSHLSGTCPSRPLTWRAVRAPSIAARSRGTPHARPCEPPPGEGRPGACPARAPGSVSRNPISSSSVRVLCVLWWQLVTIASGEVLNSYC